MASTDHCDRLRAIIEIQNEIVATGLDLDGVTSLVAARARSLTGADAVVVELAENDGMVCVAATGNADADAGSTLCAPMREGERELGAVKAYAGSPERFDVGDGETLDLLAGVVAAHLSPAASFEGESSEDHRDPVTDLPNRGSYEARLALEAERARRYRYPLALVRLRVDGLAAVGEELGDRARDEAAREVAALLSGSRFADEAFRIGESEFAILLPHTDLAGAEAAAARLSMHVSSAAVAEGRVSAVWGAACDEEHPAALHERAGRALTAARDDGRYASAG